MCKPIVDTTAWLIIRIERQELVVIVWVGGMSKRDNIAVSRARRLEVKKVVRYSGGD